MNGLAMRIKAGALGKSNPEVRLLPLDPGNDRVVESVARGIAQPHINKWLFFDAPGSLEETREWMKKSTSQSKSDSVIWGVFVEDECVGTISLSLGKKQQYCVAGGGKVLYRKELMGKGISYLITLARMLYTTDYHGQINQIQTEVMLPNVGSWQSMARAGYALTGALDGVFYQGGKHHSDLKMAVYLPNHPVQSLPAQLSEERLELLVEELTAYPGLGEKAAEKLRQLNRARPNYAQEIEQLLKAAREVITYE